MTATDILRRMLDERGVEYTQTIVTEGVLFTVLTSNEHYFILVRDNNAGIEMWSQYLTPEQAIAATLGSCNCPNNCTNSERTETCHIDLVGYNQHEDRFQCRSCDWSMWFKRGTWPQFNYCPNCGRKVVSNG